MIKKRNINETIYKNNWMKKILWILLVSIIAFISSILLFFIYLFGGPSQNFSVLAFLFLSLFSYLLLNNKLYKHHYISIITIFMLDLFNYFVDGMPIISNSEKKYCIDLIFIMYILFFTLQFVLYKYLMQIKYIQYFEILFFEGLILSILLILTLFIATKFGYLDDFLDYYERINRTTIIIFIILIIIDFIYNSLKLIIINIFSPFQILLTDVIPRNIFIFLSKEKKNLLSSISTIV